MKNKHLDLIKQSIIQQFNEAYGYCGVMDGDKIAIINSGKGTDNFQIIIKDGGQDEPEPTNKP